MRRQIPREGTERIVKRFFWYPVRIEDDWRWLEIAPIKQIREKNHWVTTRFADNELLNLLEGQYRPGQMLTYEQALEAHAGGVAVQWSPGPKSMYVGSWRNCPANAHLHDVGEYRVKP